MSPIFSFIRVSIVFAVVTFFASKYTCTLGIAHSKVTFVFKSKLWKCLGFRVLFFWLCGWMLLCVLSSFMAEFVSFLFPNHFGCLVLSSVIFCFVLSSVFLFIRVLPLPCTVRSSVLFCFVLFSRLSFNVHPRF